jgi:hypothetical protein
MNLANALKAIYSEKLASGKKHWYGAFEYRTNAVSFWYEKRSETDTHKQQMKAVIDRLLDLTTSVRDGNNQLVADLIYSRSDDKIVIVAFRFTSDWAWKRYHDETIGLGSLLGHGAFRPFVDDLDASQFID